MASARDKKQTVYAFIDSQNLNLGVRSQGWSLDWRKFRQLFTPNKHYSTLYKPFAAFVVRIDWLRGSLEYKKTTGISGRSKP